MLMNTGRWKVNRKCTKLRNAIGKLKWDPDHPDRPEDKNIGNGNDWWDAENYTILDFIECVDLDR